ncbi:MAG: SWIM zinc finger family protein [Planctomycetes bacterium]|nr:SWIM zinc finger family protein [Planctomycetota bacterium]
MISIDEAYVDSAAPNADAAKNGRGLVTKKSFVALYISADKQVIFGQCQGSGKTPYECSCDFGRPENPTYRCSCPSRQFPCKHCIGLMYAYTKNAAAFKEADLPANLQEKREKAEVRAEKKKEAASKPKQVNKSALEKKIKAQLEGITLLEQLTESLVTIGIGNMNAKSAREIEQRAKQLGDAFLPGAQSALRSYTTLFHDEDSAKEPNSIAREKIYSDALDHLSRLYALAKQGRIYLEKRLADPDLQPETDSTIAAWLGHAWQLAELREAGLMQPNRALMQLTFHTYDDIARQEYVDTGIWIDLEKGALYTTKNYRPYKAVKFIKAEDSFFQVAQVPELFIYPGDLNPRIRWDGHTVRPPTPEDYAAIRKSAHKDFAALIKLVKGGLKGPLSERQPIYLLAFSQIGIVQDTLVVEDAQKNRLTLTDRGLDEEPSSLQVLKLVPDELRRNQVLVARFRHDLDTKRLEVKPLGIVSSSEVVRMTL